jgi:hypothetical protein
MGHEKLGKTAALTIKALGLAKRLVSKAKNKDQVLWNMFNLNLGTL